MSNPDSRTLEAVLRADLTAFIQKAYGEVVPGNAFLPNWHIQAMAYALEQVLAGRIRRLIITVPPRHLKSVCASVAFPAFALGHDPTRRIIAVSYAQELASKHALDCRRILESPWYQRTFPGTRISPLKNTEGDYVTTQGGFRFSTSVGGSLTGRGGNLIIIDDPQKPADALSAAKRASLWDWYANTLFSRLDTKGEDPIILVMQRLHLEDLAGYLLAQGGWTHLNLPAIAQEDEEIPLSGDTVYPRRRGDILHPAREDEAVLAQIKQTLGSYAFSAQYLQEPIPEDGSILHWDWFRRYKTPLEPQAGDLIAQSWDTAIVPGQTNDFSCCTTWLVRGERYGLLDVFLEQLEFPDLLRTVVRLAERWDACEVIIENAGSGTALLQALRRERSLGHRQLRWHIPRLDKVARMAATSPAIERGQVFLPDDNPPWLKAFRQEVVQFPNGAHDDQIDSLSQFLLRMEARGHRPLLGLEAPSPPAAPPSGGRPRRDGWPRPGIQFW